MKTHVPLLLFIIILVFRIFLYTTGFESLYKMVSSILLITICLLYVLKTKRVRVIHLIIIGLHSISEVLILCSQEIFIFYIILLKSLSYVLLFYFLYQNHRSFKYNVRDLKVLWSGSILYTFIFTITLFVFQELQGIVYWSVLGNLSFLYILLIITGMHYINIRSVKSLYFFLAALYFTINDFSYLLYHYYISRVELKVIGLFCQPFGFLMLLNYMITKSEFLKSEEFEGF